MIHLILFSLLFSAHLSAYTPQNKKELFIDKEESKKALACNQRYINFLSNYPLFEKIPYDQTCTCEDIQKRDPRILHHYSILREAMTTRLSYAHVGCEKNIWLCINPTHDKDLEDAKTADTFCDAVEKKMKKMFHSPFVSDELRVAMEELRPMFNAPKRDWGMLACKILLPKANLHPKCRLGGGIGGGAGQTGAHPAEVPPAKEELH